MKLCFAAALLLFCAPRVSSQELIFEYTLEDFGSIPNGILEVDGKVIVSYTNDNEDMAGFIRLNLKGQVEKTKTFRGYVGRLVPYGSGNTTGFATVTNGALQAIDPETLEPFWSNFIGYEQRIGCLFSPPGSPSDLIANSPFESDITGDFSLAVIGSNGEFVWQKYPGSVKDNFHDCPEASAEGVIYTTAQFEESDTAQQGVVGGYSLKNSSLLYDSGAPYSRNLIVSTGPAVSNDAYVYVQYNDAADFSTSSFLTRYDSNLQNPVNFTAFNFSSFYSNPIVSPDGDTIYIFDELRIGALDISNISATSLLWEASFKDEFQSPFLTSDGMQLIFYGNKDNTTTPGGTIFFLNAMTGEEVGSYSLSNFDFGYLSVNEEASRVYWVSSLGNKVSAITNPGIATTSPAPTFAPTSYANKKSSQVVGIGMVLSILLLLL